MRFAQLYAIDLAQPDKPVQLTRDFRIHAGYSFSPDGARIVFISSPPGEAHPDRTRRTAVWQMDAAGSESKPILNHPERSYLEARYLPASGEMLVTARETDEPTFRQSKVARVADGKLHWLGANWDSSAQDARVSDGNLYFTSNWQGGEPLVRVPLKDGRAEPITPPDAGIGAFDTAAGRVVYSLISVPSPAELYVREKDGAIRRLTDLNSSWLVRKQLSIPTVHWITQPDGVRVQYWVMHPAGAQPGRKYPYVLDMHGGPSAMWGPGEFTMWHEFQTLCAMGYGVVYANPRGSSGYGYAFQKGNFKNWGEAPAGDVLAALDDAISRYPSIDRDRLFLTGGSYAGYLTAWIVGHDHRFKAAAAQRGVYDLVTFFGEGNAFRLVENSFGGFPWQPETRRLLEQQSPFTYVQNIRTPLLILHGNQDLRTGVSQSEMLFRALKQLRKPVEYVRYPSIGHELTRSGPPLQRMDHLLRIIEFFERYDPRHSDASH
jgi:dipeptidyl aminopeptidase/acylaminoacyl peptidase